MKKKSNRPLTEDEKRAANRIKDAWLANKKKLKLTQDRAAESVDWSQSTFRGYMHGEFALNISAVLKFAKVLQIPAIELAPEIVSQLNINEKDLISSDLATKSQLEIKNIVEWLNDFPEQEIEYIWALVEARKKLINNGIKDGLKPIGNPVKDGGREEDAIPSHHAKAR